MVEMTPMVCFHFFYKQIARERAAKLAVIFRHLVQGGTFPACWRLADVVPVAMGSPCSHVKDYRTISITLLLSKVFENIFAGVVGKHFRKIQTYA